jgi:UDP-glucose 4-epimerase
MKALVTGGSGFIGSRLVHRLLEGEHRVRVLDVQTGRLKNVDNSNLEFVGLGADPLRGGMLDRNLVRKAVRGVDVVYHLAINWNGHTWRGALQLPDLFNANIKGTWNLLDAAKSSGVKQVLFAGSIAVYGKRKSPVMSEDEVCRPELWHGGPGPSYAIVKLATERLCLMYHYEFGLPATVFRIDVVFDESEYQDLDPEAIRKARKGDTIEVVRGEGGACVHVDDVARAFMVATSRRSSFGQVFNISNPEAYISDIDVYRVLVRSLASKSRVRLVEGSGLTGPRVRSILKAQRVLGWTPQKTRSDVEATIVRMIKAS